MFNFWLTIITLMFVAGVVLRLWRLRLGPVVLHKVALPVAVTLVGQFLESCYDGQFGFPSGLLRVESVTPNRVVAREVTSRSSHFTAILGRLYRAIFGFTAFLGMFGFFFSLALAALLTPVLLYAALTEVTLRYLLRSQIVADFMPAPGGAAVTFRTRGPVALLVRRRIGSAFQPAPLPPRVAVAAGLANPAAA